ncbi:heavy-metal-associated domain-containing protein [Lutibacter holmesii]|uniref:Heavy-metal-associated domain-containing protein n=1 Tax=Lutibacter holmesii TaxID=1137985 RepID=A0ABW3WRT6_9FLAO
MKKIIIIAVFLIGVASVAQNKNAKASIHVDGVCEMCEKRIETACIKTKGVKLADWNVATHELKLIYNENKTNLYAIKKSIVAVGHDTEGMKASDEAYNNLHECCKYRDEEVKAAH